MNRFKDESYFWMDTSQKVTCFILAISVHSYYDVLFPVRAIYLQNLS